MSVLFRRNQICGMSSPSKQLHNRVLGLYLLQLAERPILTKAVIAAILQFTQDALSNALAGVSPRPTSKATPPIERALALVRADKVSVQLALYGFTVSAPLSHFLSNVLAKVFAGKTGLKAKLGMILASNLIVAPINTVVFLACLAVIHGARTVDEVKLHVKRGFLKMMQVTWMVSPTAMVLSRAVPVPLWPLYYTIVGFTVGTTLSTLVKKGRIAEKRKPAKDDGAKGQSNEKP